MSDLHRFVRARTLPDAAQDAPAAAEADRLIAQGNRLEDDGEFEGALRLYREALRAKPDYAKAHLNIGNALRAWGRTEEAASALRKALQCSPDYVPARFNLGALLAASGELADAERELREALRLQPDFADAAVVLADVLESAGRPAEAESELRRAVEIRPGYAGAWLNLGLLHLHQSRFDEAEDALLRARAADPSLAAVDSAFGTLYLRAGRVAEATRAFRQALERDPTMREAQSALLFSLNLAAELDATAVFQEHVRIGKELERAVGPRFSDWPNPHDPQRRIRVGYVSGDFGGHAVGMFMLPVLEHHDRGQFEIHCYHNKWAVHELTLVLRRSVEHWHDIAGADDDAVSQSIRTDGIDILVDLSGHTDRNRLTVFARHPAPLQVTWLGYLNTTGLAAMDYRICDRYSDPQGAERYHTERLLRLPHSQWCYAPQHDIPVVQRPHAGQADAIVFGSFNQYAKISDACLDLWCRILDRIPEATLVVLGVPSGRTQEAFRDRVARRRIDPSRVVVDDRKSILEYFAAIANVDIALDTLPYNGATTTLDTLWMGVPLVALRGDRGIARGGYSILQTLGLPELTASSPDEYVDTNVRLARDPAWRRSLRSTLRSRLAASPLMDSVGFVRDLEAAYRQIWRAWCRDRGASPP